MESVHVELDFNNMIISVCDTEKQRHKSAKFWLPWSNWQRFETYLKMAKVEKLQQAENGKEHLAKLIVGRIILRAT